MDPNQNQNQNLNQMPQELVQTLESWNKPGWTWKLERKETQPDLRAVAVARSQRAEAAAVLLNSGTFNDAYREVLSDLVDQYLNLPAGDFEGKKLSSFQIDGLQAVIRKMAAYVREGEQLLQYLRSDSQGESE